MDLIGSLIGLVIVLFCALIWLLPIIFILASDRTSGKEKFAWILAVIFITWFAWIFYMLLAPLSSRDSYGYRR